MEFVEVRCNGADYYQMDSVHVDACTLREHGRDALRFTISGERSDTWDLLIGPEEFVAVLEQMMNADKDATRGALARTIRQLAVPLDADK